MKCHTSACYAPRLVHHLKLLVRLWIQPAAAMGDILDRGSLLFASIAVVAAALALRLPVAFYTPLLMLAVVYVPGLLLLAILIARLGAFGTVFERDYAPLLTCAAMAWTAAQLPILLARWTGPLLVTEIVATGAYLYFALLMFFAVQRFSA